MFYVTSWVYASILGEEVSVCGRTDVKVLQGLRSRIFGSLLVPKGSGPASCFHMDEYRGTGGSSRAAGRVQFAVTVLA